MGGTDLEVNAVPGYAYDEAPWAVRHGFVAESFLDAAVSRTLTLRARLGLFDPPTHVSYNTITNDTVLTPEHVALCRDLAAQSIVLLQVRGRQRERLYYLCCGTCA
jgi:beta-glucosidase